MDVLICIYFYLFLLNVLWGLLFKYSKIGFGTTMGCGDIDNVLAVTGDVQVINRILNRHYVRTKFRPNPRG